ncbi:YraN family protein [Desertimonas flava]|jgi:putative endonuclease|uniref:YraN family protein n=1 Tax=Desertimonas flava TaxID=2064846 RepID=UPI000E352F7F|nr:YraN family protein [Desertimonas flava]
MRAHLALGRDGEDLAAAWYRAHGFTVVDRNWRTTFGEIDLVARRGSTLVVSEVKTRRRGDYGSPALAVGPAKQRRLRRLAAAWLREHPHRRFYDVRFDVVAVTGLGSDATIDVYPAAF